YVPHDHHHRGEDIPRRVTGNQATAECNMCRCIRRDTLCRIASFGFRQTMDRIAARDFKPPGEKESAICSNLGDREAIVPCSAC
ncbi:hypothetical protein TNCV_3789701, partial [Trichonephila clavipes]